MAAEALILEDAYKRGYTDAVVDMRKKKRQRQQREQEKKARRWYFIKQKACGLAMLAITVLAVWATEGDITIAFITVPLGLTCLISKEMLIMNDYYFTTKERKKNHDTDFTFRKGESRKNGKEETELFTGFRYCNHGRA